MIVVWRVTERCNLSCKFCGFDRTLARSRRDAQPEHVFDFAKILAHYQTQTGDRVLLSWIGGEPLLWKPLTHLTKVLQAEFGLRVSTTTNGSTLASPEVRAHLLNYYQELTISVDGLGEFHDQVRGWPGGFQTLQRDVSLLARERGSRERPPRLRANTVLMRDNIANFENLCHELANWGIDEITFNQLGGNDRPEFYPTHRLWPDQADRFIAQLPSLRAALAERAVQLRGTDAYLQRIHASTRDLALPVSDCHPAERFLFINEAGLVAPCSFTTATYGWPVTALRSLDDLLELPHRFRQARQGQRARACEDCHSTQVFEKFST